MLPARRELGDDMEPAVIDAFVERLERRLAERNGAKQSRSSSLSVPVDLSDDGGLIANRGVAHLFTGAAGLAGGVPSLAGWGHALLGADCSRPTRCGR